MGAIQLRQVARVAVGVAAVLAQMGVAIFYLGWSVLVVPRSAIFVLVGFLLIAMVVVIWLAIRHTWLAPIVPIASIITLSLTYAYGEANLGWGG